MEIAISKEFMYKETKKLIQYIFGLPESISIEIKGILISSSKDEQKIIKAINKCYNDAYSDVDIEMKIKLNETEYNNNSPIYSDCISRLGFQDDILGMSHYRTESHGEVIRVCKMNGMRFNLIVNALCKEETVTLPHGYVVESLEKADNFWFIAVQALGKLMRKDYLISTHLTHMLVQETLVLQMNIRDNEKNTNVHRYGYAEKLNYLSIYNDESTRSSFLKVSDETYNHISKLLYSAVKSYDGLSVSLNDLYKSRIEKYLAIWEFYCKE